MNNYVEILKTALIFFPFIAFIISIPFILIEYHKFGAISFFKSLIIYSFTLYFICAYFLIILPLPSFEEVKLLTTPKTQLIPFNFVIDFISHTSFNISIPSTYFKSLNESCFYVPIYNLLLTMPFAVYLRYYFNFNLKKVTLCTFLLSLFFELTQLSGLYFIYERGYRLFDVDDLILNTIGAILGYYIFSGLIKKLPKREKIEKDALKKGREMTGFKRSTAFILDLVIYMILNFISYLLINNVYVYILIFFVYYVIIPYILKGSTLANKYINIKVINYKDKNNIFNLFLRESLFILIYFIFPLFLLYSLNNIENVDTKLKVIMFIISIGFVFLIYSISFIKYLFTNKPMLYEKISRTKMISTIK